MINRIPSEDSDDKMENTTINDWLYVVRDDNTINLVRYIGNKKNIIIPKDFTINNTTYKIVEISSTALSYGNIEKVLISEGINLIE